jgi:hypothetical protein
MSIGSVVEFQMAFVHNCFEGSRRAVVSKQVRIKNKEKEDVDGRDSECCPRIVEWKMQSSQVEK